MSLKFILSMSKSSRHPVTDSDYIADKFKTVLRTKKKYLIVPSLIIIMGMNAYAPMTFAKQKTDISLNWPQLMQNYLVRDDSLNLVRVDYAKLNKAEHAKAELETYISLLEGQDPDHFSNDEALTYWANLYNAVTIKVIVDNYPVKSIREIKSGFVKPGPWDLKLITVNDKALSLNDIEHGIMRKKYPSPMIHYMVNCASIGCPNIKYGEWRSSSLNEDQIEAAKEFINSPRGVKIDDGGLILSSIYKWFKDDFGGTEKDILEHIELYANPELDLKIKSGVKIKGYDYDWSLNGTVPNSN